jgi:hypothetical protein
MNVLDLTRQAASIAAEVDEAMWLRAREGDVAAAKVVYARLAQLLPPAPSSELPPTWAELQALIEQVQQQQKALQNGLLDDTPHLGAGAAR